MRIAVTGSTGMIGSALATISLEQGHEVVAIVRPGSNKIHNLSHLKGVEIIECDISDYKRMMGENNCDIFFHLAWEKTFGEDRDNAFIQMKNIEYTLDAVSLAYSWGASTFVGAGSQAEYGKVYGKINSDTPTNPTSGYGIAKYSAGKLSRLLCQKFNIRFSWARILSVFGEHDADHTLIMYLINTLLDGNAPKLTKCEQIWDYMYSGDAASALLAIGLNGIDGKTYPIGSGESMPLKEYVLEIKDIIDPKIKIEFGAIAYYPHQPMMLCADITNLTIDTGFVPKYRFKDGVTRTIDSVRSKR